MPVVSVSQNTVLNNKPILGVLIAVMVCNLMVRLLPALIRATNECTVKKTLMNPPQIDVTTTIAA
jgi:hypothetical protein